MSDIQPQPREPHGDRRPRAGRAAFIAIALLVLGVVVLAGRQQPSLADTPKVDIVYISVTAEGPTARAWFDGAPSPGLPVQEALTRFAREGYKVAAVTEDLRSTVENTAFVVLLQRER